MATPIILPDCAQKLLARLYPTVDWSRVIFLSGLPFWASSATSAITLPDPIDPWRFRIYLGSNTDFCDPDDVATLVHEAFHIGQFMSVANGYGFGFLRPAFIGYFGCQFAHGYDNNPYELAADEQEKKFKACYKSNPVCDCSKGEPVFNPKALEGLVACNETLVVAEPRAPSCGGWWWLLALPVVLILAVLVFIIHWFDQVHCHLIEQQYDRCMKWAYNLQQQCQQWATQSVQQCAQWADQGYNRCDQWADEGYDRCDQWSTTASSSCCTWWPCSWGCKALVWVFSTICTITVWVSNLVCKLTVWVASLVCIATVLISQLVCLVVTSFLQSVCLWWKIFWNFFLFCWI